MAYFEPGTPLISQLASQGMEFDQKLFRALEVSASTPNIDPEDEGFPDSYLTLALYRLNSTLTRLVDLDESKYINLFHEYKMAPKCSPDQVLPGWRLCDVLNEAAKIASPGDTIGVGHFLQAVVRVSIDLEGPAELFPGQVMHGTFSVETLLWGLGYHAWTPLSDAPEVRDILTALDNHNPIDDCEYLMAAERGRIVLRPISALDDFRVRTRYGRDPELVNAILAHRDRYGSVRPTELLALEDLINSRSARENDFQRFFEEHPHFFRSFDLRTIFPRVLLSRPDDGDLIPDFLLVDPELQKSMILELKLPDARLVTRRKNRDRLSSAVSEARAQLLEYQSWFDSPSNRRKLARDLGLEVYRPRLAVMIGTSASFNSAFERQKLQDRYSDVEIVTYDDIIEQASRRLALVSSASRHDGEGRADGA